ncbi:TetR family transcriptional regulator [Actinacidiphila glaucinigra]|uniref:TetR family transcriptional regulator n=1 Tax=Actinacidiphila glaucinigra TaxID=235986 RepID=UPI0037BE1653
MAGGRPRAFDVDEVLDRALEVFWRQGYEGTGISDLTRAMGINPPSLYGAFGNKEGLFKRVLDHYADGPARYIREAFAEPDARRVVERLLHGAADATTRPDCPPGCLTVQGGLAASAGSEAARDELTARRAAGEVALRLRLEKARADGELPAEAIRPISPATSSPCTRASPSRRRAARPARNCTGSSTSRWAPGPRGRRPADTAEEASAGMRPRRARRRKDGPRTGRPAGGVSTARDARSPAAAGGGVTPAAGRRRRRAPHR